MWGCKYRDVDSGMGHWYIGGSPEKRPNTLPDAGKGGITGRWGRKPARLKLGQPRYLPFPNCRRAAESPEGKLPLATDPPLPDCEWRAVTLCALSPLRYLTLRPVRLQVLSLGARAFARSYVYSLKVVAYIKISSIALRQ